MKAETGPDSSKPLHGLRVIEIATVVGGPYCAHLLADYGAEVIKLEGLTGDSFRYSGPSNTTGLGSGFSMINRNKRSLSINLKDPGAKPALTALIESADILLHNIRRPAMIKLGLDYQAVSRINPTIIYAHLVGYDSDGPYGSYPAYEDLIQTVAGAASLAPMMDGEDCPRFIPTLLADKVSGQQAATAILSAVVARLRFGKGACIEIPMMECLAAFLLVEHMDAALWSSEATDFGYKRMLNNHLRPFKTQDGYIGILAYSDTHWRNLLAAIDCEELQDDPRLVDHNTRVRHLDELYAILHKATPARTTEDWLNIFIEYGVPASPYNAISDLANDPHLRDVNFFAVRESQNQGRYYEVRSPVKFDGSAPGNHTEAPMLGEHSRAILGEIGIAPEVVQRLIDAGVVRG